MTSASPKVFISYSHDTVAHQERVLDLADRLRADGVDAEIDQYNDSPPDGWPSWCERQIEAADFVLMVCTETYHRRVKGDEKSGTGRGVVWEAAVIRQLLYDAGAISTKFVPVLFSDASPEDIPRPIKGWSHYVVDTEDGYEGLYRRLSGQPRLPRPALGTIRTLPTRNRKWSKGTREAMSSPASEHLDHAPGGTEAGPKTRWQFLRQRNNRQVLSWLGVGLTVLVVGGWTVFVYLFQPDTRGDLEPPNHVAIEQVQVPEWVPVYPGAKVDGLSSTAGRGGRLNGGFFCILPEDWDAALKFYKTNLELKRWNVKIDSKPGEYSGGTLSATSEDGRKSIVVTSGSFGVSSRKYLVAFEKSGN